VAAAGVDTMVEALAVVAYEWPRARHGNTAVDRPG
jgi:hypothetical protein